MSYDLPQGLAWNEGGYGAIGGDSFTLFAKLEKMFLSLASKSEAREYHFPVFISAKELKKLDYFKSFPQLIHFPVSLDMDEDNLRSFQDEHMNEKGEIKLAKVGPICECLTPAACYHFYITHQNQVLPHSKYFTTRAHCFRQEKFYEPLRRQRNFNMREIVCIGTADEVKDFLGRYKEIMTKVLKQLKLPVDWEIATDPFFDPESNPKFIMQTLDPVKQEMILFKGLPEELSIGSINYHKNYFGDGFNIKIKDETAFSGCVAFGLERWIYAITKIYGTDEVNWPKFEELDL